MTPAARLQAAIEILTELQVSPAAADRFLRDWWGKRRYAGSKDRADVTERVYRVLRHRASLAWRSQSENPRAWILAALAEDGLEAGEIAALFSAGAYGPAALTEDEYANLSSPPLPLPDFARGEYPQWAEPALKQRFGAALMDEMTAMQARAPVDLRVNSLRAERADMLVGLRALGLDAEATPYSPWGVRIPTAEKLSALQQTQFFQTGAFEIQDEASQIVALLCGAKPGMRVLDLAAGAGGKSLALAAMMDNRGEIVASDLDALRLKPLGPRARRAGATIITAQPLDQGAVQGPFDVVLVDAPCSGSGTWRRNPETKWRLTPARVETLVALQQQLLDRAASFTRPGGRLVYAVCSIFPAEGPEQIAAFLERCPDFRAFNASASWNQETGAAAVPPGLEGTFQASPLQTGTDGFFAALLERNS